MGWVVGVGFVHNGSILLVHWVVQGRSSGCKVGRKCGQWGLVGFEEGMARNSTTKHNTTQQSTTYNIVHYSTTKHNTAPTAA